MALLGEIRRLPGHTFLADDVSPAHPGAGPFARIVGYRQVTDAHLLTLALRNGGSLATFDRRLAEPAPPGQAHAVEVIP